jgi:hypothetical protein
MSVVILLLLPGLRLLAESTNAAVISFLILNLSCSVCLIPALCLSLSSETRRDGGDGPEREPIGRNPRVMDGKMQSTLRG